MENLENKQNKKQYDVSYLLQKQKKNPFCIEYIEEDTFALYNINTEEMIDNKYFEVFGEYMPYTNIMLRSLYEHFEEEGHKIENPEDFIELCKNK